MMWIHTLFTIFIWPLAYILPATFRAMGNTCYPMIVSLTSLMVGRFFCSWLFGIHLQMGTYRHMAWDVYGLVHKDSLFHDILL